MSRSRFQIDENHLDREWRDLPDDIHEAAVALAGANLEVAQAKAELELREAELSRAIRDDPPSYGIAKVSEAQIEMAVRVQPAYREALMAYNNAKYGQDVLKADLEALHVKKYGLQDKVVLWCRDYSSKPVIKDPADNELARAKVRREIDRGAWPGLGEEEEP